MYKLLIDTTAGSRVEILDAKYVSVHSDVSNNARHQVEELPGQVLRALEAVPPEQIAEVLVNVGPGKYAALRSGIAFAKGIARGWGKPVYGFTAEQRETHLKVVPLYEGGINAIANVPAPIVHLSGGEDGEGREVREGVEVQEDGGVDIRGTHPDFPPPLAKHSSKHASVSAQSTRTSSISDLQGLSNHNTLNTTDLHITRCQNVSNSDCEKVSHLISDFEQQVFARDAWSYDSIKTALQDPNYRFYLLEYGLEHEKSFAGAIYTRTLPGDDSVEIMSVGLLPEYRGRGFAGHFLAEVIADFESSGKGRFLLEVRESNQVAQKLYSKLGFAKISTRKKYYANPNEDAYIFELISKKRHPIVLGIESSCDETGVGIVQNGRIIGRALASSMDEHKVFGGVIPELASRMHLEAIDQVLDQALIDAKITLSDVDAISVAAAPGLVGCLATGTMYAKGLAIGLKKRICGVNHVLGHIMAATLDQEVPAKFLSLIVSGGHSSLVLVDGLNFTPLGGTIDDAAGEAFDKVGRLLGLSYPAGPEIDKLARRGNPQAIDFPRPLLDKKFDSTHKYDFSFSGLKTAAVRELERQARLSEGERVSVHDFCASFAFAVADVLTTKTLRAAKEFGAETVVIGGGFSANSQLRDLLQERCASEGISMIAPRLALCTDNGEMIANLGEKLLLNGADASTIDFGVRSVLDLSVPRL